MDHFKHELEILMKDPSTFYTGIALFVVTILLIISGVFAAFRGKKRDTILLLGLCGSGKTVLFYQLRDGSQPGGTVTSMEENDEQFVLNSESSRKGKIKPVHIIDIPGHERLRAKLDDHIHKAQGIIFMVDALDFVPNLRATAEYLYDVLCNSFVIKRKIPILILCNKMDKITAHSMEFIRKQLEKELDKLRATRSALPGSDSETVILGHVGEPFKFAHCANNILMAEGSALTGQIDKAEHFIRQQVKP